MEPTAVTGVERTHASISGASGHRELTVTTLDELLSFAMGLLAESAVRDLAAARARVAEDRFNLVVLGEFKRGKSTLINALLGRGEQHTRVRLEQLAQIERRCVELATELGAVAAADDHQAGRRVDES